MYLDHWELQTPPFDNAPDGERFFPSPQHEEAAARLTYAAENAKGAAMLTGEVGCGKTTVARAVMHRLPGGRFDCRMIENPATEPVDFIRSILYVFGERPETDSKSTLLDQLRGRLLQRAAGGVHPVLFVDEVHVIRSQATFEELRMLLNLQHQGRFLMTLILLGQMPLLEKIAALQPLAERLAVTFHLESLDYKNMTRYVAFRLKQSGARRGIFKQSAMNLIYEYAAGLPLRINTVCDRSLLVGMMRKAKSVDADIVKEALEDIQWKPKRQ